MKPLIEIMQKAFSRLLGFYPRRFRSAFMDEMETVFGDLLSETSKNGFLPLFGTWLRELISLPVSILREIVHEFKREGTNMLTNEASVDAIQPDEGTGRGEALLAVLPYVLFGIISIISKLDPDLGVLPYAAFDLFALIGLTIGGIKGYPRWSYCYLGWAGMLSLLWNMAPLNPLSGFIPFSLAIGIPLLWWRSLAPLRELFRGIWKDWTRLSLALFSFAGYVLIIYDENHHPWLFAFMLASIAAISAAVWIFIRNQNAWGRVLALVAGFVATWLIGTISDSTWDVNAYYGIPPGPPEPLTSKILGTLAIIPVWLMILFWPVLIGLVHQVIHRRGQ